MDRLLRTALYVTLGDWLTMAVDASIRASKAATAQIREAPAEDVPR